jgi:hypothetical protein
MTEVQGHGFFFENWVKFVLGVKDLAFNYTQKWDIPGKTPVSVKFMGIKNAIEFGSALRMWEIKESFTLIVGRWVQVGSRKIVRSIDEIEITPEILEKMKGGISIEEIKEFDQKIKSFPAGKLGQKDGIAFAKIWKSERRNRMGLLTITHKIDSKDQRRIQCNLNFKNYLELFGPPSKKIELRGIIFNQQISHGPRKFNKKYF